MAYRTADHTRWQQLNFVTGIEIKLSNNHNCRGIAKGQFYDICDELAGVYPKDFKFVGWHPFCRCFAVPKLADMDEFLKYQDKLVAGEDVSGYKFSGEVTQMPKQFNEWIERNRERVKTMTSVPYFVKDNGKYIPKDWVDGIGSLTKGRDKGIITDIKEAIIKLKDATFVTEKEVRNMIEKYAEKEPSDFYGGLASVKIGKGDNSPMMSNNRFYFKKNGAYDIKNGNTITIYNSDFTVIDPAGNEIVFNPLHEVKGAMKAIANKTPLTFNQEYAIESLWHEIRHAGAKGWDDIYKINDDLRSAMECINQFCARRSYDKLLRAIGGSASHKKEIIKSGYGYSRMVRHFDEMLFALNVSSSSAYAYFSKIIMVEPYENIFDKIVQFLVDKGVDIQKAKLLIKVLPFEDKMFSQVLKSV